MYYDILQPSPLQHVDRESLLVMMALVSALALFVTETLIVQTDLMNKTAVSIHPEIYHLFLDYEIIHFS